MRFVLVVLLLAATSPLVALAEPAAPCGAPCAVWASRSPAGPANEVHVAVDPTDEAHVLVVAKDYGLGSSSVCRPSGALHVSSASYVTFDGGASWSVARVPAPYPGDPQPSPLKFMCGSDPVALFAPDGTAYYVLLNFDYAAGRRAAIAVARSDDGGRSWPAAGIRVLHESSGDDKEWATITRDGRLHVVWTDLNTGRIWYARTRASFDDWEARALWSAGSGNPAVTVAGGPSSDVTVAWRDGARIRTTRSVDGGATFSPVRVALTVVPFESSVAPRLPFMPQLAADADPASPFAGSIYVVWPHANSLAGVVRIAWSRDGGSSWSAPVVVSASPRSQAMPTVALAPGGRIDVAWLEQAAASEAWTARVASSADGGASFGASVAPQSEPLVSQWSRHQDGSVFIGDYIGVASTASAAMPAFPGNGVDRLEAGLAPMSLDRADAYLGIVPVAALVSG